jgi:hypothetical protein
MSIAMANTPEHTVGMTSVDKPRPFMKLESTQELPIGSMHKYIDVTNGKILYILEKNDKVLGMAITDGKITMIEKKLTPKDGIKI